MPGLCALVGPGEVAERTALSAMLRRMTHYGWFEQESHVDGATGFAAGCAHLGRPATSPAIWRHGAAAAVLDGELYQADDERRRLRDSPFEVRGPSDAELLAQGWAQDGDAFLARLHGCFSALVWNGTARELTVITDRFGMRPLYITKSASGLAVATEIKPLLLTPGVDRSLSNEGLAQFFSFGHFFNDDTVFAGIRALPAATRATYRADGRLLEERRYWKPQPSGSMTTAPALIDALENRLAAAVHRRARPGERLGLSLSAGLDARTILGLMPHGSNLKTVSIGLEGSIDHRGAGRLAHLAGVPHRAHVLDGSFLANFEHHLRSLVLLTDGQYLDQGIVMPTLQTYRDLGIDFLLRGHGGELLHMRKAYAFSLDDGALHMAEGELESWLYGRLTAYMLANVPRELFTIDLEALARQSLRHALRRAEGLEAPVDRVWHVFLTERLHRETALSMHTFGCFASVRMPYIDNDVVDILFEMPAEMKMGDTLQTEILRRRRPDFLSVVNSNTGAKPGAGRLATDFAQLRMRVAAKLGVRGYQPYERLGLWLKRELRPFIERVLLGDGLGSRRIVRPDIVKRMLTQHLDGRANHTYLIMSLLIFELGQRMLEDPARFAAETETSLT